MKKSSDRLPNPDTNSINLRTAGRRSVSAFLASMLFAVAASAVDSLQIQVHEQTNILLRWPSIPGQTFIIVRTKSLCEPIEWTVLESEYHAFEGTNETIFVHYDQIPAAAESSGENFAFSNSERSQKTGWQTGWKGPLVIRNGGTSTPVPLAIYPQGINLQGHSVIWPDGTVEAWTPELAEGYALSRQAGFSANLDGFETLENEDSVTTEGSCGFYRVLGVKVVGGITNNATLTDFFSVAARPEYGLEYLRLLIDGQRIPGEAALFPPFTNTITFDWVDSARISNGGPYNLQIEAVYRVPTLHGSGLHHALSQPILVSVFNELSYPNWDDATEDEVCGFDIVSAHPVAD